MEARAMTSEERERECAAWPDPITEVAPDAPSGAQEWDRIAGNLVIASNALYAAGRRDWAHEVLRGAGELRRVLHGGAFRSPSAAADERRAFMEGYLLAVERYDDLGHLESSRLEATTAWAAWSVGAVAAPSIHESAVPSGAPDEAERERLAKLADAEAESWDESADRWAGDENAPSLERRASDWRAIADYLRRRK